jgi:hypothetical protein
MMPVMEEERAATSDDLARHRARRAASWAALGFVLMQLAWLLVMPPATGIDEFDHVYRADSVALGHWQPVEAELPYNIARGGLLRVRADVAAASGPACAKLPYTGPFNCRPFKEYGDGTVEIASGAASYNPLYYAVVGSVGRPLHGNAAIYAMRMASALLCAALLALAVYLVATWARTAWPLALLIVGCLPTTVYSTSVVAPNGVEMASGLLLWACLLTLAHGRPCVRTEAQAAASIALIGVLTTHTLGAVWVGLTLLTWIVYVGVRPALAMLAPRNFVGRLAWAAAAAGVVFELWWLWYAQPNSPARPEGGLTGRPWGDITNGLLLWPLQAVGAYPMRNNEAPASVYGVAFVLFVVLAVLTVRALRHQRRLAWATGLVLLLSAGVPAALTYATYHEFGLSWQGRYGMPFSVGLFLLAGAALDRRRPKLREPLLLAGVAAWGFAHTIGPVHVLGEFRAAAGLATATDWWIPSVLLIAALGTLGTVAWWRALESHRHAIAGLGVTPNTTCPAAMAPSATS